MTVHAEEARALFDANAGTYDRVNSAVSLGLDRRWRRRLAAEAVAAGGRGRAPRVLDAFGGTGLVGVEAASLGARVVVADTSVGMLAEAQRHATRRGVQVLTVQADLSRPRLPLRPESFDAVTCCFGVRYMDDPDRVLARLGRLLRPGGRLAVMEFVQPEPRPLARMAAAYFFGALPAVASWLAGEGSDELYRFLVRSTERLGGITDLRRIVREAGLPEVRHATFGFGLVGEVVAVKE